MYKRQVVDTHLSSINAGADVILTNTFTTRRVRMEQNQVGDHFNFVNQKKYIIKVNLLVKNYVTRLKVWVLRL